MQVCPMGRFGLTVMLYAVALRCGFIDATEAFFDATHIKASANKNKAVKKAVKVEVTRPACFAMLLEALELGPI